MTYDQLKAYLLSKPEVREDYPFGPDAAVFKIKGKLYAILGVEAGVARVNLKCDPEEAIALRDVFEGVIPGYHMNKKHWNTVILDGTVPQNEIERMVDNSYKLVFKGLKKSERQALAIKYLECAEY